MRRRRESDTDERVVIADEVRTIGNIVTSSENWPSRADLAVLTVSKVVRRDPTCLDNVRRELTKRVPHGLLESVRERFLAHGVTI